MSIDEIFNSKSNITVSISVNDLNEFFEQRLADMLNIKAVQEVAPEYKSAKETCAELNVDLSTLWRWQRSGYLVPSRVGRRRMYKATDLQSILESKGV